MSNQEYYYIRKLIHLLSKKHISDYSLRNLKKVTEEYIKDYLEQFPDDTYEEIKDLIWSILKDYKKFIKRKGVNS
jgi:hypothetical protein